MDETFKAKLELVVIRMLEIIKNTAPYDTGNLRNNAILLERSDNPLSWKIYVDFYDDDKGNRTGIAPYMPFTNEPWISDKWKGKQNPNEGWWQRAVQNACAYATAQLGGSVSLEEE